MLLRSHNQKFNSFTLGLILLAVAFGAVLLSLGNFEEHVDEEGLEFRDSVTGPEYLSDNGSLVAVSIVPSWAPVVPPPTPLLPVLPEVVKIKNSDVPLKKSRFVEPNSAPFYLSAGNSQISDPQDFRKNKLPRCEEDGFQENQSFGSAKNRNFYAVEHICVDRLKKSIDGLGCVGLKPSYLAASYSDDGNICRCGGIMLQENVCVYIRSMNFTYLSEYLEPQPSKACDEKTDWDKGKFVEGRYIPPSGCEVFDINPRFIVRTFPNKLFLFDGDSHQQDKFFGFLAEMRNQKVYARPSYVDRLGAEARYEVSEFSDDLELLYFGATRFNDNLMKCRTTPGSCTVFVFRFDRTTDDYLKTAKDVLTRTPDFVIGAFISQTYSNSVDAQPQTKASWERVFRETKKPIHFAWTSFAKNSPFIVQNTTKWVRSLRSPMLRSHITVLDASLYAALWASPGEPGDLTFALSWHDSCQFSVFRKTANSGIFDSVLASEMCAGPVARSLYRVILSIFVKDFLSSS
jgi:hypothetical protein